MRVEQAYHRVFHQADNDDLSQRSFVRSLARCKVDDEKEKQNLECSGPQRAIMQMASSRPSQTRGWITLQREVASRESVCHGIGAKLFSKMFLFFFTLNKPQSDAYRIVLPRRNCLRRII